MGAVLRAEFARWSVLFKASSVVLQEGTPVELTNSNHLKWNVGHVLL